MADEIWVVGFWSVQQPSPSTSQPTLTATVHDRTGALLPGLVRGNWALKQIFGALCVLATDQTSDDLVSYLEGVLGAHVIRAPANGEIGRHRRQAVEMALRTSSENIVYADLDHVLRWIEADPAELTSVVTDSTVDFTVVGRTPRAMKACPARLQETESLVNHIYALATGHFWDLMFAVRVMSPAAANVVVAQATENSYANDVEWPIIVERAGLSLGYYEADGLSYRIAQDFDAAVDNHDADPLRWIERVNIANLHAQTIRRLLPARSSR